MEPRQASFQRNTKETTIEAQISLDGGGTRDIVTGIGFFNHMLEQLSRHSGLSLRLHVQGDTHVDFHHTVEDTGIVLGEVLSQVIGTGSGIQRYGSACVPMEEALVECSLDLCGRGQLVYNVPLMQSKVGEFDAELGREFFLAISRSGRFTLHLNLRYGSNQHHILEACFKAFARALGQALSLTGNNEILSTKGSL